MVHFAVRKVSYFSEDLVLVSTRPEDLVSFL